MNLRRRGCLAIAALFFFISVFSFTTVFAAEKTNALAYKTELEAKYGMKISGEGNLLTGKDAMSYLTAYDKGMNLFTAPFIKELVGVFKKDGVTTSIRFGKYNDESDEDGSYESDGERAVIELLVESPYTGKPTMGADPQTITHEIGHMLYYGICVKYGEEKFNRDWEELNEGYPYGEWTEDDEEWEEYQYIYVSNYAATDPSEDFAEIIAYILTDPEHVHEITSDPEGFVMKAKVDFIEKIVKKYFSTFKGFAAWGYNGIQEKVVPTVPTRPTLPALPAVPAS